MKIKHKESDVKVYITKNYNLFNNFKENRDIKWSHVHKIINWIEAKDLKIPIIVTSTMSVIDGQHTLEARKKLKKPIYYIIESSKNSYENIAIYNAQRQNWVLTDYIDFYTRRNYPEYIRLNKYMNAWNLAAWQVIYILSAGKIVKLQEIKEGKFVANLTNEQKLKLLSEFILDVTENTESRRLYKGHTRVLCDWFVNNPSGNFEPAIFILKLKKNN